RDEATRAVDRDRLDRIATCIKMFGLSFARGGPIPDPPGEGGLPDVGREANSLWGTRMIRAGSRNLLPGWDRAGQGDGGVRFTKGDRRLYLLEAHADVEETQLGGDLVYVRKDPDALVVVQYKRAVIGPTMNDAYCRMDERFGRQLSKLRKLTTPNRSDEETK